MMTRAGPRGGAHKRLSWGIKVGILNERTDKRTKVVRMGGTDWGTENDDADDEGGRPPPPSLGSGGKTTTTTTTM